MQNVSIVPPMRSWIPVPGTTIGRLVDAALVLFGSDAYDAVSVGAIARRAGVTTGALYHHFGSKASLYRLVRADVEQRVVDRIEGAASARPATTVADLAPLLLIGFDYLISSGSARLLGEDPPGPADGAGHADPIEHVLGRLIETDGSPVDALIAAAWRAALRLASHGPSEAVAARAAFARLLTGL